MMDCPNVNVFCTLAFDEAYSLFFFLENTVGYVVYLADASAARQ
jgi:hypothetical protein